MKTKTIIISLFALVMLILVFGLIPNITKIAFPENPLKIEDKGLMKAGVISYKKGLISAERTSIKPGYANMMEGHLIRAEWNAREKGVDISKKVKGIYARGSISAIELALTRALYGHKDSAKQALIKHRLFCSNAGIQPDKEKIAEVEKIIQRN